MAFGLTSNEQAAVNRARDRLKSREAALRDAQEELNRTPRVSNLKATQARDAARDARDDARSDLITAEAKLEAAKR